MVEVEGHSQIVCHGQFVFLLVLGASPPRAIDAHLGEEAGSASIDEMDSNKRSRKARSEGSWRFFGLKKHATEIAARILLPADVCSPNKMSMQYPGKS